MNRLGTNFTAALLSFGTLCAAQTPQPIRSLPKAPGDTSGTAPRSNMAAPADTTPVYLPSTAVPVLGSEALPALAPTTAPLSAPSPQPVSASAPVTFTQPGQTAPVAAPVVSLPASTPAAFTPTQPTPADLGPTPLHGAMISTTVPDTAVLHRSQQHFGAFSAVAVQLKGGFAGAGIDIATPLAQRLNLRVGASVFQYNGSFDVDGLSIDGVARLRSASVQLDIFPFGGGFRVSPGLTVYNNNSLNANVFAPPGTQFDLGDASFTSGNPDGSDPVRGTAAVVFGNQVAPSLTVGWGNMIPRSGRHWSIPFEIGVQFTQAPKLQLNLSGTACGVSGAGAGCEQIQNDPETQQDVRNEESDINSDISPLRFYPIVSIGFAWAFHLGKH